jgi:hypothetical protein
MLGHFQAPAAEQKQKRQHLTKIKKLARTKKTNTFRTGDVTWPKQTQKK